MTQQEEWRAVRDYEGIYEVSSFGRIRSLEREDSAGRKRNARFLRPGQDKKKGYLNVGLCKDGKMSRYTVHAVVAEAFLGPRPSGLEVSHKDHDPSNNHYLNLEYLTHGENMKRSAEVARMGPLAVSDIQDVREIFAADPKTSVDEIAELLGVSNQTIVGIVRATRYVHVPNRDGSPAEPIECVLSLSAEYILELQKQGYTIPEIARMHDVDYSTPYQALRRAGIHQPGSNRGTGRRASKARSERLALEGLPLFLK